ncbi:MAG: hypothetical protein FJ314_05210, partial [SAR202 cluster bacterium]|nr:hypothetical protein [SAR202 cluster bacterium]
MVTALAAVALLLAAIVGLQGGFRTAHATHPGGAGNTHTDGAVYLTNLWSGLTTEASPSGTTALGATKAYVGAGKTLYATFIDQLANGSSTNFIALGSNIVLIDVVDADKNSKVATGTTANLAAGLSTGAATTTAGLSFTVFLPSSAEIIDRDGDGALDPDDVTIDLVNGNSTTTMQVTGVAAALSNVHGGAVTILVASGGSTKGPNGTTTLLWSTSVIDTLPGVLKITSTQDSVGIMLSAIETGKSTGRFIANVQLVDVEYTSNISTSTGISNSTTGAIKIQNGGVLTVKYLDDTRTSDKTAAVTAVEVSATVTADSVAPTVSVTGPTHNKQTQDRRPIFSGTVSDTASGVKKSSVLLVHDNADDAANAVVVNATTSSSSAPTLGSGSADGDTTVTWTFTHPVDIPTTGGAQASHKVDWLVTLSDLAGNQGFSDSDGDSSDNFSW